MKTKITTLIAILTISFTTFAQDFTFSYDAAGNRIERVIYLSAKSTLQNSSGMNQQTEEENAEQKTMKDQLSGFDLLLYPNPTKGEVLVKITGEESIELVSYNVYDTNGKVVATGTTASSTLLINLSRQKAGIYSLRININGKQQNWKIIKE